jgi:hypothetical protein
VLEVENVLDLTGSYAYDKTLTCVKATNMDEGFYLWKPYDAGMWDFGVRTDHSTNTQTKNTTYAISATLASSLKVGGTIIDSGSGTLTYNANTVNNMHDDGTIVIDVYQINRPFAPNDYTTSGSGVRTDTTKTTATFTRDLTVFEVLDYDAESNFKYENANVRAFAVVYKKITISHSIPRDIDLSATLANTGSHMWDGAFNAVAVGGEETGTDICAPTGTRTVEYILYVNVNGATYRKTLETFNGTMTGGSGYRCYGVSVKLEGKDGLALVSYDMDEFITPSNVEALYDSPVNYEDWNTDDAGTPLWSTSKRVVGAVSLCDAENFGYDLYDEQSPIPSEVYSVSKKA